MDMSSIWIKLRTVRLRLVQQSLSSSSLHFLLQMSLKSPSQDSAATDPENKCSVSSNVHGLMDSQYVGSEQVRLFFGNLLNPEDLLFYRLRCKARKRESARTREPSATFFSPFLL